ncbi:hypothetical protein PFLUV_G00183590 [Perca fluviatilis]|uniref:Uncharacterized protein n=1 Tax=Perca fluviatilis TaxID=8168 RepID=A0A6A5EH47_PERFL|nr:hypothetical protein PFLUV_G00183590 [Perca fluviatilis]
MPQKFCCVTCYSPPEGLLDKHVSRYNSSTIRVAAEKILEDSHKHPICMQCICPGFAIENVGDATESRASMPEAFIKVPMQPRNDIRVCIMLG